METSEIHLDVLIKSGTTDPILYAFKQIIGYVSRRGIMSWHARMGEEWWTLYRHPICRDRKLEEFVGHANVTNYYERGDRKARFVLKSVFINDNQVLEKFLDFIAPFIEPNNESVGIYKIESWEEEHQIYFKDGQAYLVPPWKNFPYCLPIERFHPDEVSF